MNIHIDIDGKRTGPISEKEFNDMVNSKALSSEDYMWHDKLDDWITVGEFLKASGSKPPPLNQSKQRKVGILLGLGIFFLPYIFSWFTIRKGHSTLSRVLSFVWLGLLLLPYIGGSGSRKHSPNSTQTSQRVARTQPVSRPISDVEWSEINKIYNLNSNYTDFQKDEIWKKYKGKKVKWRGQVSDVSKGLFGGLTLQVKMNRKSFTSDVLINLSKSSEPAALQLKKREIVTYIGVLKSWGSFLPITLDDGVLE